MPSVPAAPVSVFVDPLAGLPVSACPDLLSPYERVAGPTPDPDMDDVVLVPTEDGAVSQVSRAPRVLPVRHLPIALSHFLSRVLPSLRSSRALS